MLQSRERFDAIVVDEGQDLEDEWWVALTALLADPEDGGMRAAEQCASRWRDAGKEVRLWPASQAGLDFNDWIRK